MTKYSAELYYWFDQKDFPFKKAFLVSSQIVGQWCDYYEAKILSPKKGIKETVRAGQLPSSLLEKQAFITHIFEWIQENSLVPDLFALFLDTKPIDNPTGAKNPYSPKFDHHDDTCCWLLDLTDEEFKALQAALVAHNLPPDLFYPAGKDVCIPYQAKSLIGKVFVGIFGGQRCFTPKRWEAEQAKLKQ